MTATRSIFQKNSARAALASLCVLLALPACSDRITGDSGPRDAVAPKVHVTSPQRGATLSDFLLRVTGNVSDDESGIESVQVNGVFVEVDAQGYFEADVNLGPGVSLIQVVATDKGGNEALDTRGVLVGEMAPQERVVRDALVARLDKASLSAMGAMISAWAEDADFGELAGKLNPAMDKGGNCLGAKIDVVDVQKENVELTLTPVDGGLLVHFEADNIFVDLDTEFSLACLDGSSGVQITADRFRLDGMMVISMDQNDNLDFGLRNLRADFDDFSMDVGIVPHEVIELFYSDIEETIARSLVGPLEEKLPNYVNEVLGGFADGEKVVTVLDRDVTITIVPNFVEFTAAGGTVSVDSNIQVSGDSGPGYIDTPMPRPSAAAMSESHFRAGLADDVVDQVLSAFWASGALEKSISFDADSNRPEGLLGSLVDEIQVSIALPPTVRGNFNNQAPRINLADMFIDIVRQGASGPEVVTRFAVSARLALSMELTSDGLRLSTSETEVFVDLLDEGVTGSNIFDKEDIEALTSFVATRLVGVADDLVGTLPVPVLGGTGLVSADFEAVDGYLLVGGNFSNF